jgi:RimJ/RimL family protein N-acetyltransferase
VIETQRLTLRTMSAAFLRASLEGDRQRAEHLVGLHLPDDWPDIPDVLRMRLGQVEAHPEWEPWLTRVVALRSEPRAIGVAGFHGPPGGDWLAEFAPDGVEFRYTIYPEWRRRGYATEASAALIEWAARAAGVPRFVLSIDAANAPSLALARRLGFTRVGAWTHPERGEEEVYRLTIEPVENA